MGEKRYYMVHYKVLGRYSEKKILQGTYKVLGRYLEKRYYRVHIRYLENMGKKILQGTPKVVGNMWKKDITGYIIFEGSQPEWCISSMIYSRDTPFWSETLNTRHLEDIWKKRHYRVHIK